MNWYMLWNGFFLMCSGTVIAREVPNGNLLWALLFSVLSIITLYELASIPKLNKKVGK